MDRWLTGIGVALAAVLIGVMVSRPPNAETLHALTTTLAQRGYHLTELGDVVVGAKAVVGGRESISRALQATIGLRGTRFDIQADGSPLPAEIHVFDRRSTDVRVDQRAGIVLVDGRPFSLGPKDVDRRVFLNRGLLVTVINADDGLVRTLADVTGVSPQASQMQPLAMQSVVSTLTVLARDHIMLKGSDMPVAGGPTRKRGAL